MCKSLFWGSLWWLSIPIVCLFVCTLTLTSLKEMGHIKNEPPNIIIFLEGHCKILWLKLGSTRDCAVHSNLLSCCGMDNVLFAIMRIWFKVLTGLSATAGFLVLTTTSCPPSAAFNYCVIQIYWPEKLLWNLGLDEENYCSTW